MSGSCSQAVTACFTSSSFANLLSVAHVCVCEEVGRNGNDWSRDPTVGSGGGVPKPGW